MTFRVALCAVALVACAPAKTTRETAPKHGVMSDLSRPKSGDVKLCEHRVPAEVCTRCNPHLAEKFKSVGDWCPEHDVPESQCLLCHPDLTFEPLPELRAGADLLVISKMGEDVPSLEPHLAPGKVTVFDFYADWCAPCREIDEHMIAMMNRRDDVAVRKLNVVGWDSAIAKRYMREVPKLPYVVVYGKDGKRVKEIAGLDLKALDAAIEQGAR